MGLISAGDEHNRRGDEAIAGIANVEKLVEDIIIYDQDFESHVSRVKQVITRCSEHGITLNPTKFKFAQSQVEWCGYNVSSHGYSPSSNLVKALRKFPTPTNKTDVRSFCGLVQQFEAFSSRIAELALPLRSLLSPKVEFIWESFHQESFDKLIEELSSPRVLAQFDPRKPVRLETDAAQSRGLGYALWQQQNSGEWKLLQCGSRFVSPTESRYSATEIEMLAAVWALKKCHLFLLGQPFELIVDHRPLVSIINSKFLDEIDNPRLQRMKQKMTPYRLTTVWRQGINHQIVDCFSRYPVDDPEDSDLEGESEIAHHLCAIRKAALSDNETGQNILEDTTIQNIRDANQLSSEFNRLVDLIKRGFPDRKEQLDEDLRVFWLFRDQLSVDNGLILLGSRILVPKSLRPHILEVLHSSHQGQDRTLRRARQTVFWPGMSNNVKQMVERCQPCSERLPSQQHEPLQQVPRPSRPFESVSADLFSYAGWEYLVMVDRYSGWINVAKCGHSTHSSSVITHLKAWMVDQGIPVVLTSDNGTQFSSAEFQNWCKRWGIRHVPSSPHNPQSNGLAEAAVKSVKTLLAKTSPSGDLNSDAFLDGLMELRNTPRSNGQSPAQAVYGKPYRTKLPTHYSLFAEGWQTAATEVDSRAEVLRGKAEQHYNKTARPLPYLKPGDIVRMQDPKSKRWDTIGEVINNPSRKRSYTIKTESGKVYWRNRKFLRPYHFPVKSKQDSFVEEEETKPLRRSKRVTRAPTRLQVG